MPSQEALRDYYIDKISHNGYVSVPFPITGSDLEPLFSNFRQLSDDVFASNSQRGQDVINAFLSEIPGRPYDSRSFINQRRTGQLNPYEVGRNPGTEDKDIAHITPLATVTAAEYMRTRGGMPAAMRKVLELTTEVHQVLRRSLVPVFGALGLNTTMISPLPEDNVHVLRILRYIGNDNPNEGLAELHFDRSKFTAALWESDPGLVGSTADNQVSNPGLTVEQFDAMAQQALSSPIKHRSGSLKLFTGAGYQHLPEVARQSSGNLPMLLHGVVNSQPGQERDAVVVFMNEPANVRGIPPTQAEETGYSDVRHALYQRQLRHGGVLADD